MSYGLVRARQVDHSLYVVKTTWTCVLLYIRLLDGARLTWSVLRLTLPDDTLSGGGAVDLAKVRCELHLSSAKMCSFPLRFTRKSRPSQRLFLILPESIVFQLQPYLVCARQFDHSL